MEFDDKKLENLLKEQREEYQRYLGVLAEDFGSKLKLLAESVSGVQKQLISLRDMVAKNTEDIEIIKMDIGLIKHDLKRRVDIEDFASLEKRVVLLERHR